jgi:hypothetical protein
MTLLCFLICYAIGDALKWNAALNKHMRGAPLRGYLPPEKDPEYRDLVKPSLLKPFDSLSDDDLELSLPLPRPGDIVSYSGKWEDETQFGRIRDLQLRRSNGEWYADVVPLKESKSDGVYTIDRDGKSTFETVSSLEPLRSFYVRSENGYKIFFRVNSNSTTSGAVLRAPKYRALTSDFVKEKPSFNTDKRKQGLEAYEKLKTKLQKNTLVFGAVGAIVTTAIFGPDVSIPYTLGVFAGLSYLFLLGKKTDSVGVDLTLKSSESELELKSEPQFPIEGVIKTPGGESKLEQLFIGGRYLTPVLLILLLTGLKKNFDSCIGESDFTRAPFHVIGKEEFLGAAAGFITYMVALIATEVGGEIRTEDVLSIMPGSVAESFRQAQGLKQKENEIEEDAPPPLIPVIFVTGPKAAGRMGLVRKLITSSAPSNNIDSNSNSNGISNSNNHNRGLASGLQRIPFQTTSKVAVDAEPNKYSLITQEEVDILRDRGELVYEGTDTGILGTPIPLYLTLETLVPLESEPKSNKDSKIKAKGKSNETDMKPVGVIEGSPEILDVLGQVSGLRLINIWISLQTKEQFIKKASEMVKEELSKGIPTGGACREEMAKKSADEVSRLVTDAARDITYYMQKAPLFEYTLLNLEEQDTAQELQVLIENIL